MNGVIDPGEKVTFDITIYNQGTLDATNVVVTDYVPTGMLFSVGDINMDRRHGNGAKYDCRKFGKRSPDDVEYRIASGSGVYGQFVNEQCGDNECDECLGIAG
ncbi:MAG: hypothetical protein R2766_02695 [Saprospiraceae bacterium]